MNLLCGTGLMHEGDWRRWAWAWVPRCAQKLAHQRQLLTVRVDVRLFGAPRAQQHLRRRLQRRSEEPACRSAGCLEQQPGGPEGRGMHTHRATVACCFAGRELAARARSSLAAFHPDAHAQAHPGERAHGASHCGVLVGNDLGQPDIRNLGGAVPAPYKGGPGWVGGERRALAWGI